ncbi:cupin domain-containing protein [Actinokineospora globicatena]|uniref:cupin domain-containing protein n=1 Tax=Actinokineospora globicatena TaxID=103729 RepID=UPI0020A24FD6|nr:cupin domain-containing protein [Actinokineospora globicatena]MCP2306755.1 Cupin domain protein [Actinokineospora globicatena]GLW82126.1 hypothetical protein Aglo01_66070 [Actinokineospora globicatena]GLW88919.1 hypothetical protein Aglo02_65580 [Actinokineospora globicatena]
MSVTEGEVFLNPPCRQRIVVRTPAARTGGVSNLMDLYVGPGGFAADYHRHPVSEERFTLVRGRLRVSVDGSDVVLAEPGAHVAVPPDTVHRFFSATDDEETFAVVEFVNRAERFENLLLRQLFGLAEDGKADEHGVPGLLQRSVTMLEFADVLRFTSTPWAYQRLLYGAVAPVAKALGYRGCDPGYLARASGETAALEELPPEVTQHLTAV